MNQRIETPCVHSGRPALNIEKPMGWGVIFAHVCRKCGTLFIPVKPMNESEVSNEYRC